MTADVRDIPILFSGEMVSAILAGRKTETRRAVRWPFETLDADGPDEDQIDNLGDSMTLVVRDPAIEKDYYVECPYGGEGDRLWVRETAKMRSAGPERREISLVFAESRLALAGEVRDYRVPEGAKNPYTFTKWTPGIHMPRWASRLSLIVTEFPDVERLSKITNAGAQREGIVEVKPGMWGLPSWKDSQLTWTPRAAYLSLFFDINRHLNRSLVDPWVWVVHFRRETL